MSYTFASATVLLLLITDPFGSIPIFANALRHVPPERRSRVIVREVSIAFGRWRDPVPDRTAHGVSESAGA